ncbi:MAG: hypothetical protein IPK93_08500 [Solirubrobacterales bacterium]|nr:hypothetical protein [Solirubrobacterales bacterium]
MAHPEYIRLKAIDLRVNQDMTIDDIAECLAISRTTVFYWVKNLHIPKTEKQSAARLRASEANRARAQQKRMDAYEDGARMFPDLIQEPTFRDFICMYIGEGYKRNRNCVSICNSDPKVVKLGNDWILRFSRNPVTYSVQFHADQSMDELALFWSDELDIKPHQVKFQRKSNSSQLKYRKWRSKYGVLAVNAGDTYFRARLQAWIDLVKAEWG